MVTINKTIIKKCVQNTQTAIKNIISMEQNYIWTDDPSFKKALINISKNEINTDTLRTILTEYFSCIKKNIKHQIPKVIMFHTVKTIISDLNIYLLNKLNHKEMLSLLTEHKDIHKQRESLKQLNTILNNAIKVLEN